MRSRRLLFVLTTIAILVSPTAAYARAGGGTSGFSGGGSGGGYSGGGGSYGGSGSDTDLGSTGSLIALILVVLFVLVAGAAVIVGSIADRKGKRPRSNTMSDRAAHRSDAKAQERAAAVEAQVDEIAQSDATFDLEALKERAAWLYVTAQKAWTDRDRDTMRKMLSKAIRHKWYDELADYASRGEVNVVEILQGPKVEMVDVANRKGEANDTVTFRISATLYDYVRRNDGTREERIDGSTRPVEYWTLRKNTSGEWIVTAIEQAGEGAHHLTDAIETGGWDRKAVAREAVLEVADKTSAEGSRTCCR